MGEASLAPHGLGAAQQILESKGHSEFLQMRPRHCSNPNRVLRFRNSLEVHGPTVGKASGGHPGPDKMVSVRVIRFVRFSH